MSGANRENFQPRMSNDLLCTIGMTGPIKSSEALRTFDEYAAGRREVEGIERPLMRWGFCIYQPHFVDKVELRDVRSGLVGFCVFQGKTAKCGIPPRRLIGKLSQPHRFEDEFARKQPAIADCAVAVACLPLIPTDHSAPIPGQDNTLGIELVGSQVKIFVGHFALSRRACVSVERVA